MRGQTNVVSTILLLAIGVSLAAGYYLFSQELFGTTSFEVSKQLEQYRSLAQQYLEVTSATAKVTGSVVDLTVHIVNNGDVEVPLYTTASYYIYKDDVVVQSGTSSLPGCSNPLQPGEICTVTLSFASTELTTRDDFYRSELVMYLNEVPLSSSIDYAGSFPGTALYFECSSCFECSNTLSSAPPGSIVVIKDLGTISGDCISASGARDVDIYCVQPIVGNGTGTAISLIQSSSISIHGCDVSNFSYGIYIDDSNAISFFSTYVHDNNLDLVFAPSSLQSVCTVGTVDLVTTDGAVRVYDSGTSGSITTNNASAIWLLGSSNVTVSSGLDSTLARVSPAVALCNTSLATVDSFSISNTDIGIFSVNDSSSRIENLTVSAYLQGIYSISSAGGYIYATTFSSPESLFFEPSNYEWDDATTFK